MSRFTLIRPVTDSARLYKSFHKDDKGVVVRDKENPGVYFIASYRDFHNFGEMCDILNEVEADGNTAIVRGNISAELEARALAGLKVRRSKFHKKTDQAGFEPSVRSWVMIDIDKFEVSEEEWADVDPTLHPQECIDYVVSKLPHYFRGVSCWWQFSASSGVFPGYRSISVHLFYMLDRTLSDTTLRRWAESQRLIPGNIPIDKNVFDCIQPHYIAAPKFQGLGDPLPQRSGVYTGNRTVVTFDVPSEDDAKEEVGGNVHPLINMRKLKVYMDAVGDGANRMGYSDPLKSLVGKYFSLYGPSASDIPLKTAIRQAIDDAPKDSTRADHGVGSPAYYASDEWLDPLIRSIRDKEVSEKQAEEASYDYMLKRYVYVEEVERFLDLSTLTFRTKTGVTDTHSHELAKLAENLLTDANLKRVSRITYKPGAPEFCEDYDPNTGKIYRAYNRWTPSPLTPTSAADAGWFIDHLNYICNGDKEAFTAVLNFCAHMVQFPAEKMNFGILMQGMQGTGKSFISQVMSRVLGRHNVSDTVTPQQVMSQFTDWMTNKQLVVIEEIQDREEKFRIYNHLKSLITGDAVKINPKGLPAYDIPNRTNFMAFTNFEDAVPMDDDDRRFIIHFSQARPKDAEYYTRLALLVEHQCGSVLQLLKEVNLSGFNAKGRAPMTHSKREFLSMSGPPLTVWFKSSMDAMSFPLDQDLLVYADVKNLLPYSVRNATPAAFAAVAKKLGCVNLGAIPLPHGKYNVWSVRNHDKWRTCPEKDIIDYYQRPTHENGTNRYVKPQAAYRAGSDKDF